MVSFHSKHTHFPLCEHIGTPPSAKSHQLQPYIDRQSCEAEEQAQQVETGRLCCTRFIWDLLSGTNYYGRILTIYFVGVAKLDAQKTPKSKERGPGPFKDVWQVRSGLGGAPKSAVQLTFWSTLTKAKTG